MKFILLVIALWITITSGNAQRLENGVVTVCEFVIDSTGMSKNELRTKCKNWFGETFRSAESVISNETEDQINGNFVIRTTRFMTTQTDRLYIGIKFKDGKVKISIKGDEVTTSNETHSWPFARMYYRDDGEIRASNEEQFIKIRNECIALCRGLKNYLLKSSQEDEW